MMADEVERARNILHTAGRPDVELYEGEEKAAKA
jgi:hypothetical protein